MVKTEEIENLMKGYIDDGKQISAFEALYMWSKGINSATIAGFLLNKYNSVEGLDSITSELNKLDIRGPSHKLDLTNQDVGVVIRDIFRKQQQILLDEITPNLATLQDSEKDLLLAMIRSSLFEKEKINSDELKLSYKAIFGESIKDRELENILRPLEKRGIIYRERPFYDNSNIIIPDYIYFIQYEIEEKLPNITITKEKDES